LIPIPPCFAEAEVRALAKERQKKDNHNLSKSEAEFNRDSGVTTNCKKYLKTVNGFSNVTMLGKKST